jgi:RNA polymerase sigma-70 factor (ECF subfamily)
VSNDNPGLKEFAGRVTTEPAYLSSTQRSTMSTVASLSVTIRGLKPELEQLFREHSQMVYRTAYTMLGSGPDAEDVLQTVFLQVMRREPEMQNNPKGYLYRAAVNIALNLIRSRKRLEFTDDIERFEVPADRNGSKSAPDIHGRVIEAIADLSPGDAQVLILRYIHEHTDAEIAKLLGVSRGTVAMRLFRSRLRLKRLLGA